MDEAGASAAAEADRLRQKAAALREQAAGLEADADRWQAGADGERAVSRALREAKLPGVVVLHDRLLKPGSKVNLDHVLIGPMGGMLLDAKNWVGDLTVYEGKLWRHLSVGAERKHLVMDDQLDKVRRLAEQAESRLGLPLDPVVVLAQGGIPGPMSMRGVMLVPLDQLITYLEALPSQLPAGRVADVARKAERIFVSATAPTDTLRLTVPSVATPSRGPSRPRANRRRTRRASPQAHQHPGVPRIVRAYVPFGLALLALWAVAANTGGIATFLSGQLTKVLQSATVSATTGATSSATGGASPPPLDPRTTPAASRPAASTPSSPTAAIGSVCDLLSPAEVRQVLGIRVALNEEFSPAPGLCTWSQRGVYGSLVAVRYGPDAEQPAEVAAGLGGRNLLLYDGRLTAVLAGAPVPRTSPPRRSPAPMTAWLQPERLRALGIPDTQQAVALDKLLALLASKLPR